MRRLFLLPFLAVALTVTDNRGDTDATEFRNPILPGGYPDPSVCHMDGAWYLFNSSFEYFPGLPIHRSTDLVNWELIGHALHREEQVTGAVNLLDVQSDGGIHAPSIRCRDGRIIMTVCDEAGVPHPKIVTEAGRAMVSHHSLLVTDILGVSRIDRHALTDEQAEYLDIAPEGPYKPENYRY